LASPFSEAGTTPVRRHARETWTTQGGSVMRRVMLATIAALSLTTLTGCFIPAYSGDPQRRAHELLNTSDDFAQILDEWERIWFLDQPSHMAIYRTHGGIL
jgi:hypothetical protein